MCYLGWQRSLTQLAALVEPEDPGIARTVRPDPHARYAATTGNLQTMRTRLCLWYVVAYLCVTGIALAVAPAATLRLIRSTADYGEVMPRWVAMMSLALGALIAQVLRHRLAMLYPLGFFMPAACSPVSSALYRLSGDPLFLSVAAWSAPASSPPARNLLADRSAGRAGR